MLDKTDMNKYSTMPGLLHFRHRSNQDGVCFLQRLNLQGHDLKLHPQPTPSQCHPFPHCCLKPRWQFSLTEWLGDSGIFRSLVGWLGNMDAFQDWNTWNYSAASLIFSQPGYLWFTIPWAAKKKDCELPSSDHLACNPSRIHRCAFVWCCTDGPMTNLNLSAGLPGKDERSFATELWSSPSKGSLDL